MKEKEEKQQPKSLGFRPLKADEIDCRVGTVTDKGCSLLMYSWEGRELTQAEACPLPTGQLLTSASDSALGRGQFIRLLLHLQNRSPCSAASLRFRSSAPGLHPSVWSIAYIFNLSIISRDLGQCPAEGGLSKITPQ